MKITKEIVYALEHKRIAYILCRMSFDCSQKEKEAAFDMICGTHTMAVSVLNAIESEERGENDTAQTI